MNYKELSKLDVKSYLKPQLFQTALDNVELGKVQYQKGLDIGNKAEKIYISSDSVWSAKMKDGSSIQSYEGIGYHSNTAELLRGFLESTAKIIVYRNCNAGVSTNVLKRSENES